MVSTKYYKKIEITHLKITILFSKVGTKDMDESSS